MQYAYDYDNLIGNDCLYIEVYMGTVHAIIIHNVDILIMQLVQNTKKSHWPLMI